MNVFRLRCAQHLNRFSNKPFRLFASPRGFAQPFVAGLKRNSPINRIQGSFRMRSREFVHPYATGIQAGKKFSPLPIMAQSVNDVQFIHHQGKLSQGLQMPFLLSPSPSGSNTPVCVMRTCVCKRPCPSWETEENGGDRRLQKGGGEKRRGPAPTLFEAGALAGRPPAPGRTGKGKCDFWFNFCQTATG